MWFYSGTRFLLPFLHFIVHKMLFQACTAWPHLIFWWGHCGSQINYFLAVWWCLLFIAWLHIFRDGHLAGKVWRIAPTPPPVDSLNETIHYNDTSIFKLDKGFPNTTRSRGRNYGYVNTYHLPLTCWKYIITIYRVHKISLTPPSEGPCSRVVLPNVLAMKRVKSLTIQHC